MKRKPENVTKPGDAPRFKRFTEIVEDIISCMHEKDVQLLISLKRDDIITLNSELNGNWGRHIRNYYELWNPENPYTMKDYSPQYVSAEVYGRMIGEKFTGDVQVDANPNHPDNFSYRIMLAVYDKLTAPKDKVYA